MGCGPLQGTDPATDFRGAGFLSLECHLYMIDHHPALFDALRHKRNGSRSAWEYPFAAAGVNLTFTLLGAMLASFGYFLHERNFKFQTSCLDHGYNSPMVQAGVTVEVQQACANGMCPDVVISHACRAAGPAKCRPPPQQRCGSCLPPPAGEFLCSVIDSVTCKRAVIPGGPGGQLDRL